MAKNAQSQVQDRTQANQKIFAIRGFSENLSRAAKIVALKQNKSLREIMEEATIDMLRKYQEPFER